jgi:hypothetical protein
MKSIDIKNIIRAELNKVLSESKKRLTEAELVEPSEQIIKGVQKELKLKTGINSTLGLNKKAFIKGKTMFMYTSDLSREIRTPVLQQLFETLSLDVICAPLPNSIGGYSFSVSINYVHPNRGSNGVELGTIFYKDNKFTSKFSALARKSETPY